MRKVEYCSEFVGTHERLENTQSDVIRNKPFLFRGYTMLVLMELGYSVPALQVGLVGRTDHFLLYL